MSKLYACYGLLGKCQQLFALKSAIQSSVQGATALSLIGRNGKRLHPQTHPEAHQMLDESSVFIAGKRKLLLPLFR